VTRGWLPEGRVAKPERRWDCCSGTPGYHTTLNIRAVLHLDNISTAATIYHIGMEQMKRSKLLFLNSGEIPPQNTGTRT